MPKIGDTRPDPKIERPPNAREIEALLKRMTSRDGFARGGAS
jgi:hypothetical protein